MEKPLRTAHAENWDSEKYSDLRQSLVRRARYWRSPNPEEAADEVFFRAWREPPVRDALKIALHPAPLAEMPEPNRLLGWLFRCLYNIVNEQRRAFRRDGLPVNARLNDGAEANHAVKDADPLGLLLRRENAEMFQACMAKLDENQRRVLRLRYLGWSYEQIAHQLGRKENTVASWIRVGKRELYRCLRKRLSLTADSLWSGDFDV